MAHIKEFADSTELEAYVRLLSQQASKDLDTEKDARKIDFTVQMYQLHEAIKIKDTSAHRLATPAITGQLCYALAQATVKSAPDLSANYFAEAVESGYLDIFIRHIRPGDDTHGLYNLFRVHAANPKISPVLVRLYLTHPNLHLQNTELTQLTRSIAWNKELSLCEEFINYLILHHRTPEDTVGRNEIARLSEILLTLLPPNSPATTRLTRNVLRIYTDGTKTLTPTDGKKIVALAKQLHTHDRASSLHFLGQCHKLGIGVSMSQAHGQSLQDLALHAGCSESFLQQGYLEPAALPVSTDHASPVPAPTALLAEDEAALIKDIYALQTEDMTRDVRHQRVKELLDSIQNTTHSNHRFENSTHHATLLVMRGMLIQDEGAGTTDAMLQKPLPQQAFEAYATAALMRTSDAAQQLAELRLAACYEHGYGVKRNTKSRLLHLESARRLGNAYAAYALGESSGEKRRAGYYTESQANGFTPAGYYLAKHVLPAESRMKAMCTLAAGGLASAREFLETGHRGRRTLLLDFAALPIVMRLDRSIKDAFLCDLQLALTEAGISPSELLRKKSEAVQFEIDNFLTFPGQVVRIGSEPAYREWVLKYVVQRISLVPGHPDLSAVPQATIPQPAVSASAAADLLLSSPVLSHDSLPPPLPPTASTTATTTTATATTQPPTTAPKVAVTPAPLTVPTPAPHSTPKVSTREPLLPIKDALAHAGQCSEGTPEEQKYLSMAACQGHVGAAWNLFNRCNAWTTDPINANPVLALQYAVVLNARRTDLTPEQCSVIDPFLRDPMNLSMYVQHQIGFSDLGAGKTLFDLVQKLAQKPGVLQDAVQNPASLTFFTAGYSKYGPPHPTPAHLSYSGTDYFGCVMSPNPTELRAPWKSPTPLPPKQDVAAATTPASVVGTTAAAAPAGLEASDFPSVPYTDLPKSSLRHITVRPTEKRQPLLE
jgi:hypothetical protein